MGYPAERTAPMVSASARARTRRMLERIATGTKFCPKCRQTKSLREFYVTPSRDGDRFSSYCRPCNVAALAERRAARRRRLYGGPPRQLARLPDYPCCNGVEGHDPACVFGRAIG